jgi:hypothetical protein
MGNFTGPRQVRLKSCSIVSPLRGNNPYDISTYVQTIDIFESIFQNTLSAQIHLYEADALQELLPIIGVEVLYIEFETDNPISNEPYSFKQTFRIHRLINQSFPKNDERMYTLELVTPEFFNSVKMRMTKRYHDITASGAVQDVFNRITSKKNTVPIEIESTRDVIDAFIPNYTPLQAINYLTMLSRTTDTNESNYVFFQTLDKFYFKSIKTIIADARDRAREGNVPVLKINANQLTGAKTIDLNTAYNSIIQLHQDESFDVLRDISTGLLRTKTLQIDFFGRTWFEDDSRYTEYFKNTTHLDAHACYPDNFDQIVSRNVKQFIVPSNISIAQSKYVENNGGIQFDPLVEAMPMRNRQLKALQRSRTLLQVPGQPNMRAGHVINLVYPSSRVLQQGVSSLGSDVNTNLPRNPTPFYSGLHLITHVRHSLIRQSIGTMEYTAHVEVVRDAMGTQLPSFQAIPNTNDN